MKKVYMFNVIHADGSLNLAYAKSDNRITARKHIEKAFPNALLEFVCVFPDNSLQSESNGSSTNETNRKEWQGFVRPGKFLEISKEEKKFCSDLFKSSLEEWSDWWQKPCPLKLCRVFWYRARHDAHLTFNRTI